MEKAGVESRTANLVENRLPRRYSIREQDDRRTLACVEAPTIEVRIDRETCISAAAARKFPPGSIFLDGAAQGEPFVDNDKQVFNLDHHEDCVRAFTLATCEQAMVLVRLGLDLRKRDWVVYANEPDLDTVLAIWVLFNHIRLNDKNPAFRATIMPLIRLQGTIDAHGLEMQELVAFPPKLYLDTFDRLEKLRSREVELKREGRWHDADYLAYTLEILGEIDAMVYSALDFEETLEFETLAQTTLADHWLLIACTSSSGIYEVEQHLRHLHGDRLGIILLKKNANTNAYTIRRANHFLPVSLESIYRRLNIRDSAVKGSGAGNRWGGSEEIGGSPRATGTDLTVHQIVEICRNAYQKPIRLQVAWTVLKALAASAAVFLAAVSVIAMHGFLRRPFPTLAEVFLGRSNAYAGILGGFAVLLFLLNCRRLGNCGICAPAGRDWLYLIPGAALASLAGGAWFPAATHPGDLFSAGRIAAILGIATAAELLFRGITHGVLASLYATQKIRGRWYVSWPVLISTLVYALWALAPFQAPNLVIAVKSTAAVLLFGGCCAMARERSGSLLPPVLIHCACLFIPVLI